VKGKEKNRRMKKEQATEDNADRCIKASYRREFEMLLKVVFSIWW
jgi:hypothetical protein